MPPSPSTVQLIRAITATGDRRAMLAALTHDPAGPGAHLGGPAGLCGNCWAGIQECTMPGPCPQVGYEHTVTLNHRCVPDDPNSPVATPLRIPPATQPRPAGAAA